MRVPRRRHRRLRLPVAGARTRRGEHHQPEHRTEGGDGAAAT
jgi:hypothetical protein